MSSAPLTPSAIHCRDLVRKVSPDRALLAELAPPAARPGIWAFAAFDWEVARIPDLVSEPMLGEIRRQWWREAWAEIHDGTPRRHPVVEALAEAQAVTPLPPDVIEDYLDGREAEQDGPPDSLSAMQARAIQIGGGIARLESHLLGKPLASASAIGGAWSMIGELRALPHRLQQRRHGLPVDLTSALDPGIEQLDPAALSPDFCGMVQDIVSAAMTMMPDQNGLPGLFRGYRNLNHHYTSRLRQADWNPFSMSINAPTLGRAWSVTRVKVGL